jgi:hypothetical protein
MSLAMKTLNRLSVLFFTFAMGACGGGSSSVSVDQYSTKLANAICAYQATCGFLSDAASCEASIDIGLETTLNDVKGGKVKYDGSAAAACIEDYGKLSCDDTKSTAANKLTADCANVFSGTVANAGACFVGSECTSGVCSGADPTTSPCTAGTCMAAPAAVADGGDCSAPGSTCQGSDICTYDYGTQGYECQKTGIASGQGCVGPNQCADGSGCIITASTAGLSGTCGSLLADGATCDATKFLACPGSDYCDSTTTKCTKLVAPGGTCDPNQFNCVSFSTCDATNKCVTPLPAGSTCDPANNSYDCAGLMVCDSTNKCSVSPKAPTCM